MFSVKLIYQKAKQRDNIQMDISGIRRKNLEDLIAKYDTAAKFCDAVGMDPSHLSQIRGGARNIGSNLARKIENALDIPEGCMDRIANIFDENDPGEWVLHSHSTIPIVGDNVNGFFTDFPEELPDFHDSEWFVDFPPPFPGTYAIRIIDNSCEPIVSLGQAAVIAPVEFDTGHDFIQTEKGCFIGSVQEIGPKIILKEIGGSGKSHEFDKKELIYHARIVWFALKSFVKWHDLNPD